jgi:N-acetylglucosamine-6-phosphate deacetylase
MNGAWDGLFARNGELHRGRVHWSNGRITHVETAVTWSNWQEVEAEAKQAPVLVPAFVDVQINGGFGVGVESGAPGFDALARGLPEHGVLRFAPTLVSSPAPTYAWICEEHRAWANQIPRQGHAISLGLHLEGPLLSTMRNGAHCVESIASASFDVIHRALASGEVRLITCAPEREGVVDAISSWSRQEVVVALGHSRATSEEAQLAVERGATLFTHLFNAMRPFHHRDPGLVAVGLCDERAYISLIADGVHVDPLAACVAIRARGSDRTILISDASPAAGAPAGPVWLGSVESYSDGKSVRMADGTLAGSALFVDGMVASARAWPEVGLAKAVAMASETPAALLGATEWGKIEVGRLADLVVLGPLATVERVLQSGEEIFEGRGSCR